MISRNYELSEPFNYKNDIEFSKNDFLSFWNQVGKKIHWDKQYTQLWSGNERRPEWFKDGYVNVCNNVLDVHLKERGDQVAIYSECPSMNSFSQITYKELWQRVCVFSRVLKNLGIGKGDKIIILMPSYIETHIAMLSCTRIGAIYSNTATLLEPNQLSSKINYFQPKLIITANFCVKGKGCKYIISTLKEALDASTHKVNHTIIHNRIGFISKEKQEEFFSKEENKAFRNIQIEGELDWNEIVQGVEPLTEYEILESSHTVSVTFSSGTTGEPKGFNNETGCYLANLCYSFKCNYNFKAGETYFTTTNIGWSFGLNLIYGSLFHGSTLVVYEGDQTTPTYEYFRIIEKYKVKIMVSTTFVFRVVHSIDPNADTIKKYDISSLKSIILGGENISPLMTDFIAKKIGAPINDSYGQTETGVILTYPSHQVPFLPKSSGVPVAGLNVGLKSPITKEIIAKPYQLGELVIKLPLSPLHIQSILYDDQYQTKLNNKYLDEYPDYYRSGDIGYFDENGYYFIVSRTEDTINIGNNKLAYNTFFEDFIQGSEMIYDNVVVPVSSLNPNDPSEQAPAAFVILKDQFKQIHYQQPKQFTDQLLEKINKSLIFNAMIEKVFIKHLIIVNELPRSISNKKIRNVLTKIYNGEKYNIPTNILNPHALLDIEDHVKFYKALI
ncbi:hypothetical protein DICPUDRAFT_154480 [Dictyostelium purpureum]|uniref:AMP-dependent synthetase/ligase domain-containing protein n=1 Tax=Dictyostelium purpureum TaxID=5786 RepID=F0ZRF7_DICPU|nr:uncharacterized protein DICPUDRAFT_154480 [Dictyostelium purpureum]EGC33474.1 hypothetical protein DICPUDRAFT_154480 [Dictyostelium purpureum]|eukprot:XP_003289997.1 hypothetical protein DICPUDRAFT_154480 [Dictyostelium purpureum]